jgi:hypothetical protein
LSPHGAVIAVGNPATASGVFGHMTHGRMRLAIAIAVLIPALAACSLAPPSTATAPIVEPGGRIEPGQAVAYRLNAHCGIEWLGPLNGVDWRTDVPDGVVDFVPAGWAEALDPARQSLVVGLVLTNGADPVLQAESIGQVVTYRPANEPPPGCD